MQGLPIRQYKWQQSAKGTADPTKRFDFARLRHGRQPTPGEAIKASKEAKRGSRRPRRALYVAWWDQQDNPTFGERRGYF